MADPAYIVDGVLTDGEAWVGIAHESLSLPAATVTWTSTDDGQTGDFSQYMDLVIVAYTRSDLGSVAGYLQMNFNNSTGARHWTQWFYGDGASVAPSANTASTVPAFLGFVLGASAAANEFSCTILHMWDINSGKYKTMMSQSAADSDGDGYVMMNSSIWNGQAPITEIDLTTGSADFVAGSAFSLFGILPRMVA